MLVQRKRVRNKKIFFIVKKIKRRATILMLAFSSGYRQVALTTNKHRIVHALKRELPVCLFSVVEWLGVFDEKRTRAKSSDFLYVLIQAVGTKRTRGLKIRRRVPHCENTDLPQQRWQAANCNAFVGWCLFRRWQIACKKDRSCEEDCLRKTCERWNQAFCRYLAACRRMNACSPALLYAVLFAFVRLRFNWTVRVVGKCKSHIHHSEPLFILKYSSMSAKLLVRVFEPILLHYLAKVHIFIEKMA